MRRLALAALVLLILSFPPSSEAKKNTGGAVLWEDEFAIVEIAASDGRVAAVGTIPNGAGGRTSLVRVYDTDKASCCGRRWFRLSPWRSMGIVLSS